MHDWYIYKGDNKKRSLKADELPPPPPWRNFDGEIISERKLRTDTRTESRGETFMADPEMIEAVNMALYLRRPLLVTGKPGSGKSSLACSVAWELGLGSVLHWPVTTRSNLLEGQYQYDALGRLQELQIDKYLRDMGKAAEGKDNCDLLKFSPESIGRYIRLGPLGTALLPSEIPRVLLIDEIDKSDIDLPNDLLNVFEEGEFVIPELARMAEVCKEIPVLPCDPADKEDRVIIREGKVKCRAFPFILMTSNGERELPAPFLRRCLRLDIRQPGEEKLAKIVAAHFKDANPELLKSRTELIQTFLKRQKEGELATDQLLNAVYLRTKNIDLNAGVSEDKESLIRSVFRYLDRMENE